MRYADFKGIELSRLGMGNMRLPTRSGITRPIDAAAAQKIVDLCMESGVNYYDTAFVYHHGTSESFLGEALSKYPRESYYLATKYLVVRPSYKRTIESQLKKLKTDYIDFYLIHSVMDATAPAYEKSGAIEYFLKQRELGRIKYLGFSSHASVSTLERFASRHDWDFVQLQVNYYDWMYGTAKAECEVAERYGLPVFVMEPLRGGKLSSLGGEADAVLKAVNPRASISSWGMRWLMGLDNVKVVLSGMNEISQVRDNVETFSYAQPLDEREQRALATACKLHRNEVVVPCTACGYCTDDCPAGLDIPEIMAAINDKRAYAGNPGPEECIGCGACATHCPQGIDIPALMRS